MASSKLPGSEFPFNCACSVLLLSAAGYARAAVWEETRPEKSGSSSQWRPPSASGWLQLLLWVPSHNFIPFVLAALLVFFCTSYFYTPFSGKPQFSGPALGVLHPRCPSAGKIAKRLWGMAAQKHIPTWLTRSLPGHRDKAAAPCGRLVGWLCWAVHHPERGTALHPTAAFHRAFTANGALCYIL